MMQRYVGDYERAFNESAEKLVRHFRTATLEDVAIVAVQHLLPTNRRMFEWLIRELGLRSERAYILGKCYSTDETVLRGLREAGVHVASESMDYSPEESFSQRFSGAVDRLWSHASGRVASLDLRTVILLDDGGQLLARAVADGDFLRKHRVIGIEQTTAGVLSWTSPPPIPVINVARSSVKLDDEARIVAVSIVDRILERLPPLGLSKGLIIGAGAVGTKVGARLRQLGVEVSLFDVDGDRSELGPAALREQLSSFSFIVGATGACSISETDLSLLHPNCILMSASSGDVEFPSASIRSRAERRGGGCHVDVGFGGRLLANSGFPINFSGDSGVTDPEVMFLTRGLVLIAVLQAASRQEAFDPGWVDLEPSAAAQLRADHAEVGRASEYRLLRDSRPTEALFRSRLHALHSYNILFTEIARTAFGGQQLESISLHEGEVLFVFRDPSVRCVADGSMRCAPFEILNFGFYEPRELNIVLEVISRLGAGSIIDLGAHIGWYSLNLARRYSERVIHSFEPIPRTFDTLTRNIAINSLKNVIPHLCGIAARQGRDVFYYDALESVLASTSRILPQSRSVVEVTAETLSLDEAQREFGMGTIAFVKIDVEGAELGALQGAELVLRRDHPALMLEIYEPFCKCAGYSGGDLFALLARHGYEGFAITQDCGLRRVEGVPSQQRADCSTDYNFVFLHPAKHRDCYSVMVRER